MDLSYIVGSNTVKIGEVNTTLGKGDVAYVTGDVSKLIGKTAYVVTDKDAYAGLEITLDNGVTWHSLIAARDEVLRDEFSGIDGSPLSSTWVTTRHAIFSAANTYAKINANKMRISILSTSGYSQSAATIKTPISFATEKVIEFILDETQYPVGSITFDLTVGVAPTLPTEGGTRPNALGGWKQLLQIINGNVLRGGVSTAISSPSASQVYRVVVSSTNIKVYRGNVLIVDQAETFSDPTYYLFFQVSCNASGGLRVADIDNLMVWSNDATAKTKANKLWVKTLADVVPDKLRLVIQNDFVSDCKVKAALYGQA